MHVRFLIGPAGSGKTSRCLQEMASLLQNSEGPPLLMLAPKQATYQLERQLLSGLGVAGYTRLQILSFERLAEMVLENLGEATASVLDEQGRVMVLRALLMEKQPHLKIFHATARLPGFARQLSGLLQECQQVQWTPDRLRTLAQQLGTTAGALPAKLTDLAELLQAYLDWLSNRELHDASKLLELAAARLRATSGPTLLGSKSGAEAPGGLRMAGLWMDGFAEMTPQELDLLSAVVPYANSATLAFCMDHSPASDPSWLSSWAVVGQTFRRCHQQLSSIPGVQTEVEVLERSSNSGRFRFRPALARLEAAWNHARPNTFPSLAKSDSDRGADSESTAGSHGVDLPTGEELHQGVRLIQCAHPEAEAIFAAQTILRWARTTGGRFREVAILVRSLETHHAAIRRVLTRYGIPFFMDRREPVGHHPLAELTRSALRIAALNWQRDDVFSALKTGLLPLEESEVDWLETAALAEGWNGTDWLSPLGSRIGRADNARAEALRARWVGPLETLAESLSPGSDPGPTGDEIAGALLSFWESLNVESRLETWTQNAETQLKYSDSVHRTVWEEMVSWLKNLEIAFASRAMPLREWLPILEAGLATLTVGMIPPALDQVTVGALDRSRNPELKLAFILGMNEGWFPAPPSPPKILSEAERRRLLLEGSPIGTSSRREIGHERYYGYIACTRASEGLFLSWSAVDPQGTPLNPSPFIGRVREILPDVPVETFAPRTADSAMEHPSDLAVPLLQWQYEKESASDRGSQSSPVNETMPQSWAETLSSLPEFSGLLGRQRIVLEAHRARRLPSSTARELYGTHLETSISALEDFASCPFKFFVARGLEVKERALYETDPREQGTLQHALLEAFHRSVQSQGKLWRDLTAAEARERAIRMGQELLVSFKGGLFRSSPMQTYLGNQLIHRVATMLGVLVHWMKQYEFDPRAVELDFGLTDAGLPAWALALEGGRELRLRGRIDRIDLRTVPELGDKALAVVVDYKSSVRKLEPVKVDHGLQLQLLSYLGVLRNVADARPQLGVASLEPAGVFFVALKPEMSSVDRRESAASQSAESPALVFRHMGRFNRDYLEWFDNRGAKKGDQFQYIRNTDGRLREGATDAVSSVALQSLMKQVEGHLKDFGNRIFRGEVDVSPYQIQDEHACDRCEFQSICRFDAWADAYRQLRASTAETEEAKPE